MGRGRFPFPPASRQEKGFGDLEIKWGVKRDNKRGTEEGKRGGRRR